MSDWMKTAHLQDTAGSSLIRWNYKYYTHVQFCVTQNLHSSICRERCLVRFLEVVMARILLNLDNCKLGLN